ncbi:MAG: M48 family metallopeptidase [Bacteroidaceae bacterium]|mgnify:CR=1 FL=1|nr:M48 family metallopeptidase [Bacteroidaceae bacterium]
MKKLFLFLLTATVLASCGTSSQVPITGRTQRLIVSDEEVLSLSSQQYNEYMQSAKTSTNAANTQMVKSCGQRLANAVTSYLTNNGYATDAQKYQWEFNLVQDNSVNAFCMPGGKIVVYEGLLPVTQDETSLAIVIGHEIAHAVAKHSAERLSNQLKQQYGTQILGSIISGVGASQNIQSISSAVFGLGTQLGTAAYDRKQESEADRLGLIFAAMAGYDPAKAIPFWQRMASISTGAANSIFSSHPSDEKRIADIQTCLPEAQQYYKPVVTTTAKKTTTTTAKKTTTTKKK